MPKSSGTHVGNSHWEEISKDREEILNVRAEITRRRTTLPALVERVGNFLAHPLFFFGFLLGHLAWVVLNLPMWPWPPWDPYPFVLLATIASAEAPIIALLVLMRQQRDTRINELREEINLQVSLHLEREISLALRLLHELEEKLQVESRQDPDELRRMESYLDPQRLMEELRSNLRQAEGDDTAISP